MFFKLLLSVLSTFFVCSVVTGQRLHINHPYFYPYAVSLQKLSNNTLTKYCSGIIVSQSWILTNAQCADENTIKQTEIIVHAGVVKAYDFNDKNSQLRKISKIIRHPKYNYDGVGIPKYDLVMLKMDKPLALKRRVRVARLSKSRRVSGPGEIIGWGATKSPPDENQSEDLLYASLDVVDFDKCRMEYADYKDVWDKFCVGDDKRSACFGDAGGAFVQYEHTTGMPIVVGLASVTAMPCTSKPALYTNIGIFVHFIENTIKLE